MSRNEWHVDDETLRDYARGRVAFGTAASVEAHLVRCGACRRRFPAEQAEPMLEASWTKVQHTIQTPPEPSVIRLLRRLGLSEADGVLLSAARSLNGGWTLATLAVVVCAALAAAFGDAGANAPYLLVSPLVPVAGVVVAFASVDPLDELTAATPYPKARLALLRTFAVVVTSVPLAIGVGLAIPGIAWLAFAWLLPALVLTLVTLIAMTWWAPEPAGAVSAVIWLGVIAVAYADDRDVAAAFGPTSQVVYLALAIVAACALAFQLRTARTPGGHA